MASTYLEKTFASAGNRKTMTFSFWIKRGNLSTAQYPMSILDSGTGFQADMRFAATTDVFRMYATDTSGTPVLHLITDRVFRDTNAWYHIVWEIDTTQATASDRVKLYVNGVRETSFSTETYPAQNIDLRWNGTSGSTGGVTNIGAINAGGNFDGSMSHIHFIDGIAYDASYFGETDANGVWKIKTSPSVTYGTNGFFILKDGNSVTDQSGNGNNFTVASGTLTNTEDSPSNVFATFNALAKSSTGTATYSNGNTTVTTDDACLFGGMSTLGMTAGKYYAEAKRISQNSGTSDDGFRISFGVTNVINHSTNSPPTTSGNYIMIGNGTVYNGGTDLGILGGSANISDNGVQQIALDLDNNRITWGFNGQWMNGSGAYNQSSPSNWVTITDPDSTEAGYFFLTSDGSNGRGYTASWNFGNGYFGTTAVASAGTNASGNGIFEYDVPTGYTALSTKGLNT